MSDARQLLRRLNRDAAHCLGLATQQAATCQHDEVTVEHFACALVDHLLRGPTSELAEAWRMAGCALSDLDDVLHQALADAKAGAARPVLATRLVRWIRDAWLEASLEANIDALTPAWLLVMLGRHAGRLTGMQSPLWGALGRMDPGAAPEATAATAPGASSQTAEALQTWTSSLTEAARAGKLDPIVGREAEIRQLIDILSRRRKNNPVVTGEPGVGKTALVEGLAQAIVAQETPESLWHADVRVLDLGQLTAGASVKGELERRLRALIDAVRKSAVPIILFIDEAHLLIGAPAQTGAPDLANLLKPALARGELRTIAATTWAEYKRYFDQDPALSRRFQVVAVDEPSVEVAIDMARAVLPSYMKSHGVGIREAAVVAAVELSDRYVKGRMLPDKAIDLIDTAAARLRVAQQAPHPELEALRARCAQETRWVRSAQQEALWSGRRPEDNTELTARIAQRDALAQDVDAATGIWQHERACVQALIQARSAFAAHPDDTLALEALAAAEKQHAACPDPKIPLEVDRELVAQVVQSWTGVPIQRLQTGPIEAALALEARLTERVVGQDQALARIGESVRTAFAGLQPPEQPRGVLMFLGPSGVGKTQTAQALAELLFGDERAMTVINMSEFGQKHMVSQLIGAPPGYAGHGTGGRLTEAVRQRPYSLILLDECEKADPQVMDLFYQVFDQGMLADGEGRQVDFRQTLIVMTSNLGSDALVHAVRKHGRDLPYELLRETLLPAVLEHFAPALVGRMTLIPYLPLDGGTLTDVAHLKLGALARRLQAAHGVTMTWDAAVPKALAQRAEQDPSRGARALDGILRQELLTPLTPELLTRQLSDVNQNAVKRPVRALALTLDAHSGAWSMVWSDS